MIGIYLIVINNKRYVGFSRNIEKRKKEHIRRLKQNKHENKIIQNTFNKYQEFKHIILEECKEINLPNREIYWISKLKSNSLYGGMNMDNGGGNPPILKGINNPNFGKDFKGKNNPAFGKKRPDLSKRNSEQKRIPSNLEKHNKSLKNRTFNYKTTFLKNSKNEKICLDDFISLREFCRIYKLDRSSIIRIIKQKLNSHGHRLLTYKGWSLCL